MGLGLTIARDIVVAHGGTIRVESELGAGSTFTMEFPIFTVGAVVQGNSARKHNCPRRRHPMPLRNPVPIVKYTPPEKGY